MNFANQKLAITGFALAAACTILGRWGLSTTPIRERDVLVVFVGGLLAGFSTIRVFKQWRAAPAAPPPAEVPPPPPAAPRSKS